MSKCHSGRWVKQDCSHTLVQCGVCGGAGWIQDDQYKPGVLCPQGCDSGVLLLSPHQETKP